ncbi:MAG: Rieske 2Fe-2S domain-containing protein, partial [Beijerinckiaceae bacterium]|nr:Rieske 2Fe-2S domain-containing protein [Beijerinckiaceae bacterium]
MEDQLTAPVTSFKWPGKDTASVPFQVYTDPDLYALEQKRIFRGPVWNFIALETELKNPGDYKNTWIGDTPIIVVRNRKGAINAMVNRCAHKGALVCYKPHG